MKSYLNVSIFVCFIAFVVFFGTACEPEKEIKTDSASTIIETPAETTPQESAAVETPVEAIDESPVKEPVAETADESPAKDPEPIAETKQRPADTTETIAQAPVETVTQTPAETIDPNIAVESTEDSVAVTINGVDITEGQIEEKIKPQLDKVADRIPPLAVEQYKKQIRQQALESMIVEQLLDEKAKDANIVVAEEDVIAHFKEKGAQQQPPLTMEDVKALIEAYGQSFDQAKQRVKKGMVYKRLMESQWAGKISVTEEDAQNYYSENTNQFKTPEQIRASHILIKPDTSDPNTDPNQAKIQAREKAEKLLEQIKDGVDFATMAKENSNGPSAAAGGDLNFFNRGQMVPAFEEAAFALKVGQVSGIVETQFGYHIIKLTDHIDPNTIAFEQIKDNLIQVLTQQKQEEFTRQYIKSLKTSAAIVYPPGKEPQSSIAPVQQAQPGSESTIE